MESCPLKSITQEKWGTHDALQAQWPRKEVASFGLLRSELTNSQTLSCKISLCVHLETMEIQLEQLILFESDEKSK